MNYPIDMNDLQYDIKSELTFSGRAARLLNNVCFSVTTQEHEYVVENPDGITATRLNVDELISLALFLEELNVGRREGAYEGDAYV